MDRLIQEKLQFKINTDEKRERLQVAQEENKQLRNKILDIDDDNKRMKKQMK